MMGAVLGFQCESTNGYEHSLFYLMTRFSLLIFYFTLGLHFTRGLQSTFYTDRYFILDHPS